LFISGYAAEHMAVNPLLRKAGFSRPEDTSGSGLLLTHMDIPEFTPFEKLKSTAYCRVHF
jgi:hypothetical protein